MTTKPTDTEAERKAFEAWCRDNVTTWLDRDTYREGRYFHNGAETAWQVWQARAALASQPSPDLLREVLGTLNLTLDIFADMTKRGHIYDRPQHGEYPLPKSVIVSIREARDKLSAIVEGGK